MQPEDIQHLIQSGLSNCIALVDGADGVHFTATVISSDFIEKTRVIRQRLVYAILADHLLDGTLHALSLKTFTPDEWQQFNQEHLNNG